MKTDQLIDILSTNLEPAKKEQVRSALAWALAIGWAAAFCLMRTTVGLRSQFAGGFHFGSLAIKLLFMLSVIGPFFLEGVRNEEKREVMRLTQEEFRREAEECGIPIILQPLDGPSLQTLFDEGAIAVVLVSGYRMFHEKFPHWLLAYAGDQRHVFVNDPFVEADEEETLVSAANLPIPTDEFQRMARFGKGNLRAAIAVRKGPNR